MDKKNKQKETSTDFKGAVSLEAIFAAKGEKSKSAPVEPIIPVVSEPVKVKKEEEVKKPEVKEVETDIEVVETIKEDKSDVKENLTEVEEVETETEAYKKSLYLIDLGIIEDFKIQVSEEDEEGVLISEFKSMTEEDLREIISIFNKDKEDSINSNYISKEGLREHELKVIEILKNGGDFSLLADKEEDAFKIPFQDFDMDDRKRQIDVLYIDYTNSKNLDKESAIALIKAKDAKGTLEKDAKEVVRLYREAHSKHVDDILKQQQKDKEFKETNFKENKKVLTAKLKEIGLKESGYRKVVSEYSKRDAKGNFELQKKVADILNNPEENYELILHLADPDLYKKSIKLETGRQTQKAIVRLTSRNNNKGNKTTMKSTHTKEDVPLWLKGAQDFNSNLKQ